MAADTPFVIENLDGFDPDALFSAGRDQAVVAIRITPVYAQVDMGLVATVVAEANHRDFTLAREHLFRDEWLLCVFEAYEEDDD